MSKHTCSAWWPKTLPHRDDRNSRTGETTCHYTQLCDPSNELKARGVEQMLFVCVDGLSELAEGIQTIFPQAHVQRCMVHLVRNSLKYIPTKCYKPFCADLKAMYGASSLLAAKDALTLLQETWSEYPAAVRVWTDNFEQVEQLFELPTHIRRMVYTTNMVEGLHSGLRKVTRGKAAFPSDDAVFRALFLRILDITAKWIMPVPNWSLVLGQIAATFPTLLL